jgi:hypothetical protein
MRYILKEYALMKRTLMYTDGISSYLDMKFAPYNFDNNLRKFHYSYI